MNKFKAMQAAAAKTFNEGPQKPITVNDCLGNIVGYKWQMDTLANMSDQPPAVACKSNTNNKEDKMYPGLIETTETERKANYFQTELNNASYKRRGTLREQFKFDLRASPESPKETTEWIKNGWFTWNKQLNDDGSWRNGDYHYDNWRYIDWKNPNRDTAGYEDAQEKLDAAEKRTERLITAASTAAEMLKALEDFESTTLN